MSDEQTDFVHRDIAMQIIGNHPHHGKYGHPVGKTPDTTTVSNHCGPETYLIELVDCPHGVDRCYAAKKHLRMVRQPRQKARIVAGPGWEGWIDMTKPTGAGE